MVIPGMVSVLVPSRGRPAALEQMADSLASLAAEPQHVEICVRLDDDDPCGRDYRAISAAAPWRYRVVVGTRGVLSGMWDEAAHAASGEVFLLTGDDVRMRTDGWDTLVRDAFGDWPDRIGLVYGRDGIADERMATHPFIHRHWLEATGRFCPPIFAGDYSDLWLHEAAAALGRLRFLPTLFTEHLHPAAGKAPMDATYQDKVDRMAAQETFKVWDAAAAERARDVAKLRAVIAAAERP